MRTRRVVHSAACWALAWLVWCAAGPLPGAGAHDDAAFFGWLVAALSAVFSALGAVGGAIGATVASSIVFVARNVAWLAARLGNFVVSTGAIFAKVWEAARVVWEGALRPAIQWLYRNMQAFADWLRRKLRPIFEFLAKVRERLWTIYEGYVRPILDTIGVVRYVLSVLGRLGVEWARKLDAKLASVQSVITDNFSRLVGYLNQIQNVLERTITFDFLFQRFALLHSLARDAPAVVHLWWNTQVRGLPPARHGKGVGTKYTRQPMDSHGPPVRTYLRTRGGPLAPVIEEMHDALLFDLGRKPGLKPPE